MMISVRLLASVGVTVLLAANTSLAAEQAAQQAGQQEIGFTADTAYPESVTWSAKQNRFFVSSVRHGTVGTVSQDGKYAPFITDDRLVSSVGLLVDDARNMLWVTNSDPGAGERTNPATQGKLAGIATYNATTGQRLAYYDLGHLSEGTHLANDVTLDADGDAYVTDSFAPVIYRISKSGEASIFAKNPLFKDSEGFNLNGIVYHRDGYLLVGKYNSGDLFRVNIADPAKVERVQLSQPLKGADGFNLVDAQHLVVVLNLGADKTVELESTDGWKSAKIVREVKSRKSMPTAATRAGKDVWVLNSRLDTLFDAKADKVSDFLLQKF
jgi:sugar lactone lactonase YvrE